MFVCVIVADSVVQELKDAHLRVKGLRGGGVEEQDANSESQLRQGSSSRVQLDPHGFVVPKKLYNPCLESRECQELHREIKWNAKA